MGKLCRALCRFLALSLPATGALAQSTMHQSHIAIENPAELSKEEANKIYSRLRKRMAANYAMSQLTEIRNYQSWQIYNDAPYISATHGQRFVNSYANALATNYATLGEGEELPAGSVLAKDSMTVTDNGEIYPGALFVMEKLAEGTQPETADWRYLMVIPDGSLFGDSTGDNAELMTYCHECHANVADRDYTFFVPEEFRRSD